MESQKGIEARSLEYVLGIEDCAILVYELIRSGRDIQILKNVTEKLLVEIATIRQGRFIEENGLTNEV